MKIVLLLSVLFSATCCMAQVDTARKEEDENVKFEPVEVESQYAQGPAAWATYVAENLRYPKKARKQFAPGTVHRVEVQFVVTRDSTVADIIIKEDPGFGLGDEARRLVMLGGKWIPAKQNGRVLAAAYKRVEIVFKRPE